jgi:hypothetical protein
MLLADGGKGLSFPWPRTKDMVDTRPEEMFDGAGKRFGRVLSASTTDTKTGSVATRLYCDPGGTEPDDRMVISLFYTYAESKFHFIASRWKTSTCTQRGDQ